MNHKESLDSLTIWAHKKGYHVELVKNGVDSICPISKLIEINTSVDIEYQIISLAHECGHALIFDNDKKFDFKQKRGYPKNTVGYKVFTVIEEIEAWSRGKDLLNRLKIEFCEDKWEKIMVRSLKKYINWASDMKAKEQL